MSKRVKAWAVFEPGKEIPVALRREKKDAQELADKYESMQIRPKPDRVERVEIRVLKGKS